MNIGKTLFAQLMGLLPWKTFHRIVDRCDGDRYVKSMTCADQFRVMAFATSKSASRRGRPSSTIWAAVRRKKL